MIVRNGEDVIRFCLLSVLLYVERVIVTVDSRSNDNTRNILQEMQKEFFNLEVDEYQIRDPVIDLVAMRNLQLSKVREKWVWIVDSDEYYSEKTMKMIEYVLNFDKNEYDTYAFRCWAVWDDENGHKSSSKSIIPRVFRRQDGMQWRGKWGEESIYKGDINMCMDDDPRFRELSLRYIHLTHIKKDPWRKEMGQERVADGKYLYPLPQEVINIIKNFKQQQKNEIKT